MELTKDQQHFNREVVCQAFFGEDFGKKICTKYIVRDMNKEHRVVNVFIPDETKHVHLITCLF